MNKRIIFFILGLITIGVLGNQFMKERGKGDRVDAAGKLTFTFNNLPPNAPVFNETDFKPGDCYTREVAAQNNGQKAALISVKAANIDDPHLMSNVLFLTISEGPAVLYGDGNSKTLENFFTDSTATVDGLPLSTLSKSASTTYTFKVCMPSETGNEWQEKKLVFDLLFGQILTQSLVINEIVPKSSCFQGNIEGQYAELYNNGGVPIPLKNWSLTAGDKTVDKITTNSVTILPGQFVILAHDNGLFGKKAKCYKKEGLTIINLGGRLNFNTGVLQLRDPTGIVIDRVDWTKNIMPPIDKSYERKSAGFDTKFGDNFEPTDFKAPSAPTPGQ